MTISEDVLSVIVDPVDRQPLYYIESENCFYNDRAHMRYPIINGIAVLLADTGLADSAEVVSDGEHKRLSALISGGKTTPTGNSRPATGENE